jgi:hypothetical protein
LFFSALRISAPAAPQYDPYANNNVMFNRPPYAMPRVHENDEDIGFDPWAESARALADDVIHEQHYPALSLGGMLPQQSMFYVASTQSTAQIQQPMAPQQQQYLPQVLLMLSHLFCVLNAAQLGQFLSHSCLLYF